MLSRLSLLKNTVHIQKRSLSASVLDERLLLIHEDGFKTPPMKFPSVWLRDNCQCIECFHEPTKSRKTNWERTSKHHRILNVRTEGKSVIINWENHKSVFDLNWLKERDFALERQKSYLQKMYRPSTVLWGKKDVQELWNTFKFESVMQNDSDLLSWLESLAIQGFAVITDAPHCETVARQLAERIGFIKRTTYGEVFEVKSKKDARNYAYLMTPLPLHTDMPYFEYKAGINILHCLIQSHSAGGANLITDGFYIAQRLRQKHPKFYEILLKTPVDWYDLGRDNNMEFHNIFRAPVICLDIDKNYHRINQNITKRDSHFTVALELVDPWYEAYDKFLQLSYAESFEFKTKPGDVFVFNNLRILHGRTAYTDSTNNKRHLIGAYVDWDIIYSKMRILKSKNNAY